ncbi:agmatine deiminase family protein [Salinibius halmophilus]|uniref:agmatine deiminase family protein n=1 Tax=Salinibius halmophilus TaxID=1853216 RepID=UPI000E673DDA|nr:agmatine deiminase family protein [Salinibius halmophilus]
MSITMLPEWHPQDAIQLSWPHANSDWQPWLADIEALFVQLCRQISQYQGVVVAVDPSIALSDVERNLKLAGAKLANIKLYSVPTNDTWARDHGPISVLRDGQLALMNFTFNAWGGKFSANLDNEINQTLANQNAYKVPLIANQQELEGGGIETDGLGTLLCTSYWRDQRFKNTEQAEAFFSQALGMRRFLWLTSKNLAGDDTDAHIDTLARFVNESTIAYVHCHNPDDPHYAMLSNMAEQLTRFKTPTGEPYQLVPLPMPEVIVSDEGDPLPATYANFLITNEEIIVPLYGDPNDDTALASLAAVAGHRRVTGINCRTAIEQYGSLHCLTMQLTKGACL